ncbi:MAG TPA: hypothetical protein VLL31_01255 [Sulfurovum sp.]|nr:hypothetical protein [Sulfurovum sp.]
MHLFVLLFSMFILTACMDTAEVPSSREEKSSSQIQSNITDAQKAKDEYETLQAQREKNKLDY